MQVEDWQPIETAPKDGCTILIAGQYGGIGVWYVETSFYQPPGHWSGRKIDPPSHWMPLPLPPV